MGLVLGWPGYELDIHCSSETDVTTELVCTNGRVFDPCASSCTPTCVRPHPNCKDVCIPRCVCPIENHLLRLSDDSCVNAHECEGIIPAVMAILSLNVYFVPLHLLD